MRTFLSVQYLTMIVECFTRKKACAKKHKNHLPLRVSGAAGLRASPQHVRPTQLAVDSPCMTQEMRVRIRAAARVRIRVTAGVIVGVMFIRPQLG